MIYKYALLVGTYPEGLRAKTKKKNKKMTNIGTEKLTYVFWTFLTQENTILVGKSISDHFM